MLDIRYHKCIILRSVFNEKGFVIGLATGLTIAGASLVLANSQIQAIRNNQIKVTFDYKNIIKNNILVIYIYSSIPEGGSGSPQSGGGLQEFSYYYDIVNDKILKLLEAASKLSLNLNVLTTLDGTSINSYDELENNHYMITIDNNDLELKFYD